MFEVIPSRHKIGTVLAKAQDYLFRDLPSHTTKIRNTPRSQIIDLQWRRRVVWHIGVQAYFNHLNSGKNRLNVQKLITVDMKLGRRTMSKNHDSHRSHGFRVNCAQSQPIRLCTYVEYAVLPSEGTFCFPLWKNFAKLRPAAPYSTSIGLKELALT